MPKVRFEVEFAPKGGEARMDETGVDEIQFLMSANLGRRSSPSRRWPPAASWPGSCWPLKTCWRRETRSAAWSLTRWTQGCPAGRPRRWRKMAQVARRKQVLCVTHLPQIAAMADTHFAVSKGRGGRTYTALERLDRTRRREELARLIGGVRHTRAAGGCGGAAGPGGAAPGAHGRRAPQT